MRAAADAARTNNSQDADVAIQDASGFPGEHTAWVFANEDLAAVALMLVTVLALRQRD